MTRSSRALTVLRRAPLSLAGAILLSSTGSVWAQARPEPVPLSITRASGAIAIDGRLDDTGWQSATRVESWYETNPGDNTPPKIRNVGYLAYDDRFVYAGFEFDDPDPRRICAPFADRDNVGSELDYGGIILDTRNTGRSAILFLSTPRGIQYDAVTDDTTGNEDSSPDFFWESAGRITDRGWILELRIPFSSLRYEGSAAPTWRILLYRNYPREYRYQFFNTTLPQGGSCFICRSSPVSGLTGLPDGGHLVLAPYVNATHAEVPRGDVLGRGLTTEPLARDIGLDLKWTPGADTAVDATLNPDFSQIESDVAQISANERFALSFPEKRPFFLEGVELFSTPIRAVYSRAITSPRWGLRNTGRVGATSYTTLVAQDGGGGSMILPGVNGSTFADQDFRSLAAIGRLRRDIGRSYVGLLGTSREVDGGGHNRVFGPDFQWRRGEVDMLTAQILWADTKTPQRPDLASDWDGRSLGGYGLWAQWLHTNRRIDLYTQYYDFDDEFRADNGFVPEVGVRQIAGEYGYTTRPRGLLRRVRPFLNTSYTETRAGLPMQKQVSLGVTLDGRFASTARIRYAFEQVRSGPRLLARRQLVYDVTVNPSRLVSGVQLGGRLGQEIDFVNHRTGNGVTVNVRSIIRPTNHLELRVNVARRWLNVPAPADHMRLFTARVDRLRATYTLNSRLFARAVLQWVETRRNPALYSDVVDGRDGDLAGSLLFAYKINWQTLMFVGFGDQHELDDRQDLSAAGRQVFVKLSYAFQR